MQSNISFDIPPAARPESSSAPAQSAPASDPHETVSMPTLAQAAESASAAPASAAPAAPASTAPITASAAPAAPANTAPITASTAPAAAPAPTTCPTCGAVNRLGSLLCENCGTSLISGELAIIGTRRFMKQGEADETVQNLTADEAQAVDTAGLEVFHANMLLRLEIDGTPTPMLVFPKGEMALGRRDPATGNMPEIDLTAFAAYRLGVSRRHAIIRLRDQRLEVYDLGSSNGTAVNGNKLAAHQPFTLRDGDVITLGKMHMRAVFQQAPRPRINTD